MMESIFQNQQVIADVKDLVSVLDIFTVLLQHACPRI